MRTSAGTFHERNLHRLITWKYLKFTLERRSCQRGSDIGIGYLPIEIVSFFLMILREILNNLIQSKIDNKTQSKFHPGKVYLITRKSLQYLL